MEGTRYRVMVDNNGDISSIFDKSIDKDAAVRPAATGDQPGYAA